MDFKVGVGKSDFAALRESGNYYVDKTELIYELAVCPQETKDGLYGYEQILCYGVAFFRKQAKVKWMTECRGCRIK